MADFTALKTAIQNAIKQNGNEEITGAILQEVMLAVVSTLGDSAINDLVTALSTEVTNRQNADGTLQSNINAEQSARQLGDSTLQSGINNERDLRIAADNTLQNAINAINIKLAEGYLYVGIATTSTNPSTPSGKVFYMAVAAGTYTNFLNSSSQPLVLTQGINILKFNGTSWSVEQVWGVDDTPTPSSNNLVKSGGVFNDIMTNGSAFDLTAYNNGTTYADLNAALTALNALPAAYKKGGISVKFVQTSDNKYVQFRYMLQYENTPDGNNAFANPANWAFMEGDVYVDCPEYIKAETDAAGHLLFWIKVDGSIDWAIGVPEPVKKYVDACIAEVLNGNDGTDIDGLNKVIAFLDDFSTSDTLAQLLNTKVDKIEGKSLVDEDYAASLKATENLEWLDVETDSDDKILGGRKIDGTKVENMPVETPAAKTSCIDNPEWIEVKIDNEGTIIEGITKKEKVFNVPIKGYVKESTLNEKTEEILNEIDKLHNPENLNFDTDVVMLINYGQSLSVGGILYSTYANFHNMLTFVGGSNEWESEVDITDSTSIDAFYGNNLIKAEDNPTAKLATPVAANALAWMQNLITDGIDIDNFGYQMIGSSPGYPGLPIEKLIKTAPTNDPYSGFNCYQRLLFSVTKAKQLANKAGKTFSVGAVFWEQGEANGSANYNDYKSKLLQLVSDLNTDIRTITGQDNDIAFITYQMASLMYPNEQWAESAQISTPTWVELDLALEGQEARKNGSNDIVRLVYYGSTMYQYNYGADIFHPVDRVIVGLQAGINAERILNRKEPYPVFFIKEKFIQEDSVNGEWLLSLKFDVPVKPMRFYWPADKYHNVNGKQPNYGFTLLNSSDVDIIAEEPEIKRGDTIVIRCSENPIGCRLNYALSGHFGGGNLCDSQNQVFKIKKPNEPDTIYTIDNFCPSFKDYVI